MGVKGSLNKNTIARQAAMRDSEARMAANMLEVPRATRMLVAVWRDSRCTPDTSEY
jgi:hypothetical protein